ncbi:16S rRNA (uracil(1498)-N(3))-methyltransferase [Sphingobacterium lumbrici]|uniref:16S rRNA (uracil(1498)-N(3))-methyltransferase n=1 Tax=Sphingobacterium lumbrici TaxID=2559600 RepID=UPI00112D1A89|nr:16S rRNA (uracil(1498)-N(3))-methyltransferase [Sphingobacterium lumbrici]
MNLFYTPEIEFHHSSFLLSEEESKHAIRVLRLSAGSIIHLVDGRGGMYKTEIIEAHPKRTSLRVIHVEENYTLSPYHLHIAVAPTKNIDRLEWFLEKATEIGLQEFTPIICAHSERKEVKTERLEKVAIAAMKQSLKAYLPKINPAISFAKFIDSQQQDVQSIKAIAHCVDSDKKYITNSFSKGENYLILIGPEGDFSEQEIQYALQAGYTPLSLGAARLRTETAALASVLEISLLNR